MKKLTAILFIIIALSLGAALAHVHADELNELNLSKLYLKEVIIRATMEVNKAREQLAIVDRRIEALTAPKPADPADPPLAPEPEK